MGKTVLNFAYGSNMCSRYLHETCPGAEPVMRAVLPNFRIEFRRYSTDLKGGISTIMASPGDMVHGVLYQLPTSEIARLDVLEDVDKGLYRRDGFMVFGADGAWHGAELYRVAHPRGPFIPAGQYIEWMIEGAEEHGLPDDYVAGLLRLRNG